MANTGYDWGAYADAIATTVLTTGGSVTATSAAQDMDIKAACEISVDADYSNHAKATGGLKIYILGDINGTDYEVVADLPFGFEMVFTQNGTNRRVFPVDPKQYGSFKVHAVWENTTASSNVSVTVKIRTADIPVAS